MSIKTDPSFTPKRYVSTKPCKRGHIGLRYVRGRQCVECDKLWKQATYAKKRDERRAYSLSYQKANRAETNKRINRWRRENPGRANASVQKRRAAVIQATPPWLTTEHKKQMSDFYALASSLSLEGDHIVPLRGENVCGLHVPWNLQMLTKSANSAKGNVHVD